MEWFMELNPAVQGVIVVCVILLIILFFKD